MWGCKIMKKELGVLLLIFVVTVGLSSAASAVPVAQTPQTPTTYGQGSHGGHGTFHWAVFRSFVVSCLFIRFIVLRIRHTYPPPKYRIVIKPLGNGKCRITILSFSIRYGPTLRR